MNFLCARLFGVTAPQPWGWAVQVRNTPVLNLQRPPHEDVLGAYVAVCAGEYDMGMREWMKLHAGVLPPPPADLLTGAVVAVGRVTSVSLWPDGRESRWYVGPVGLWLEDVQVLPVPVACGLGPADCLWELPSATLGQVRAAYAAVTHAHDARWRAYEALAAGHGGREPSTLKGRVLKKCACKRALTKCPSCRAWRCTAPTCPPHACAQGVSREGTAVGADEGVSSSKGWTPKEER
ncbi:hypothetical protein D7X74_24475 [Corallococcus sp. CA047B]|uniref:hypothetical protein n=1 Tax=Corallococcus sp. CA047B TaxID=2316729 RepID=UPI000EA3FB12|nr:hypothetical protein [Corallococcus sp. CA047B]RKH11979.1 hypothetical protein D7X74_24475 [Corallococcus sp. CA047B]